MKDRNFREKPALNHWIHRTTNDENIAFYCCDVVMPYCCILFFLPHAGLDSNQGPAV